MLSKIRLNALRVAALLAVLAPMALSLSACNTTEGAGRDISATGHAITDSARDAK